VDFHRIVVIPWIGIEAEVISEGMKMTRPWRPKGKR